MITLILAICSLQMQGQVQTKRIENIRIRDPFILADRDSKTYYMYATGLGSSENGQLGVKVYKSKDLKNWENPLTVFEVKSGFWGNLGVWAPEVHVYKGKYYLFVTFTSDKEMLQIEGRPKIKNRGTQILVSDSPEGPFKPYANKPHTPEQWMSLDGTLWVEEDIPYMIFCHEWVQVTDGTMELIKLKKDLSKTVGEPLTLFKASQANWVKSLSEVGTGDNIEQYGYITDGPFIYRTKTDNLIMIWSSFGSEKYAVGLAESESGKIKGPWKLSQKPLFKANGGHGMIFKTFDDKLMLVIHQPNNAPYERAKFFELEDRGNRIELK